MFDFAHPDESNGLAIRYQTDAIPFASNINKTKCFALDLSSLYLSVL